MSNDETKDLGAANGEKEMEVDQKEESKPNASGVSDHSDSEDEQNDVKENAEDKKSEEKEDKKASPKKADKTSNKTPKKTKKPESDDEGDSDEDGDKVALLERPVVISGKRERKKVERIDVSSGATPKEKKLEVPEGRGTALGEIANIEFKLGKTLADDLKPLHRFVYGRAGTANEIKKNLRKFCGFDFKKDSPEYTKKVAVLNKMTMAQMKTLCEILDLERGGTKETIMTRLMDFFLKPTSSGKKLLADKKRKRSSSGKGKKPKSKAKKEAKKDKKPKKPKKKPTSTDSDIVDSDSDDDDESAGEDDGSEEDEKPKKKTKPAAKKKAPKKKDSDDEDDDEESEEEEDDDEQEDSEEEQPKKKKAKVEAKKEAKKPEKKSTIKKKKVSDDESSGTESDDEPLVKAKSPKPPTNDELKDVIKKILDGANLEEVTMKTVCKQVYAKYEQFDLTDRKDFIKSTVKEIIR